MRKPGDCTDRRLSRKSTRIEFKATPNLFDVRPLFARWLCTTNFCRIHQSLRVAHAIESGVTDHHVGSPEEVVAILEDRTNFDSSLKRHHLYGKHGNGRQTSKIESR